MCGGAGGTRTPDFRLAKAALSQLSYGPGLDVGRGKREAGSCPASRISRRASKVVGHGGLEPPTSVLSGPRSNQLS